MKEVIRLTRKLLFETGGNAPAQLVIEALKELDQYEYEEE